MAVDLEDSVRKTNNLLDSETEEFNDDFSLSSDISGKISKKKNWKKAKGILRQFTESSDDANRPIESPPAAIWTPTFFATMSPEMCVDLLRHTSSKVYQNVRKRIAEADNEWTEGFFRANGLDALFEMLEQLTDSKHLSETSLANMLLPMYCVECVKAFMKNTQAMNFIISEPDYAFKLVQAIGSDKLAVKSSAVQLLSALSYYSEKGCEVVLGALQRFQEKSSKQHWTQVLVAELREADAEYASSLMALVNCMMFNVNNAQRVKMRNEMLGIGLKDLLHKLQDYAKENDRLSIQLKLFDEYGQKERRRMASTMADDTFLDDINFDDPYDLFDALTHKICDSPHAAKMLTILQSLSVFDHAGPSSCQQWEIVEQVSLALGSLDANVSDVQAILNSWQRRLSSIFTSDSSSKRNCATQTCDELFPSPTAKHHQHKSQRKRLGIKKRISVLLGIGQPTKEPSVVTENTVENVDGSLARRHKKKTASYKSRSKLSSAHTSRQKAEDLTEEGASDSSSGGRVQPVAVSAAMRVRRSASGIGFAAPKKTSLHMDPKMAVGYRRTSSRKATSLDTLFDENSQCPLVAIRQLSAEPAVCPEAPCSTTGDADSVFTTASEAAPSSTTTSRDPSSICHADATVAPIAPPLPPTGLFLQNKSYAPPIKSTEPAPFLPSVRPIIPAPRAMLGDSRSRFSVPQAPPPPLNFIRTTTTASPASAPIVVPVPGAVASGPPPPPPLPPPDQLNGLRPRAPPAPPPSLASLRLVSAPAQAPENVAETQPAVNEQFYTFPLQKCRKTKTLYWNKLTPNTLNDKKGSLWAEQVDLSMDNVNLTKIEELFSCEPTPVPVTHKPEPDLVSSVASSVASQPSKPPEQVYLVDQKTSLKISLFLKQFRSLSLEQIVASVVSEEAITLTDEQLPLEKLRGLQCCLVGVEPYIADVRAYEGDLTKLGLAEKFLWQVGQHKFFATQLEVKCLQKEFDDKVKNFANSFDTLLKCCKSLMTNQSLKNFLFITLRVGNYLNLGSAGGPAAGFKISSVKQLCALKATRQSATTLLHALVESAETLAQLDFTVQLADVHQAARLDFDNVRTELVGWTAEVKKVTQLVRATSDAAFVERVSAFFANAENSLKSLTDKGGEVELATKSLQEYFCDELKLSELLGLLSDFFKRVDQARAENEARRQKEQRLARQKEEQELRRVSTSSLGDPVPRRTSSTASGAEDSLVESLLTRIRDGDLGSRAKPGSTTALVDRSGLGRRSRTFARSLISATDSDGRDRPTATPSWRQI